MATQARPLVGPESTVRSDTGREPGEPGEPGQPGGAVARLRGWLDRPMPVVSASSPMLRRLALLWVAVSLPFTTAVSALFHGRDGYLFVLLFMGCGAYTLPGLFAARHALRYAPAHDRPGYRLIDYGLIAVFAIGCGMLVGLVTGWQFGNVLGIPAVVVSGSLHISGLVILVRRRSGHRALSVDLIEAASAVVAIVAPMVVLWWPAVVGADESWFTIPAAVIVLFMVIGTYWVALLWVRIGPGPRGIFEAGAVVCAAVGALNALLQMAQGISGFTLPFPPLIALCALCACTYLLIPLHVPLMLRRGLDQLPPQAQIRGSWLPTVVPLAGLAGLLAATVAVHDERSWAVPFSLAVLSVLVVLAGLRQMAALRETRRLYSRVEEASDERRRLLTQLLERSVNDRRRFAEQLHEQAVVAYASFAALAGAGRAGPVVAEASQLVRGDLGRHADSLRELVLSIRPLEGDARHGPRLLTPVQAYLSTIYGDRTVPTLTMQVADELVLDWVVETVLLQIVQEALHNVWRHSDARRVDILIAPAGRAATVRITDDGVGFDPATVREGAGIATMRASAAVVDGTFTVTAAPGAGTTISARLGPCETDDPAAAAPEGADEPPAPPFLRLVRPDE